MGERKVGQYKGFEKEKVTMIEDKNINANAMYGIYYDDTADILFDIHRVLRHQFYKDRGDTSLATVDS